MRIGLGFNFFGQYTRFILNTAASDYFFICPLSIMPSLAKATFLGTRY